MPSDSIEALARIVALQGKRIDDLSSKAIPIEWLEKWKAENSFHSRSSSQIVNKIIKDYREEKTDDV